MKPQNEMALEPGPASATTELKAPKRTALPTKNRAQRWALLAVLSLIASVSAIGVAPATPAGGGLQFNT